MSSIKPRSTAAPDSAMVRELKEWHRASLRRIAVGFGGVAGVVVYGVVGYMTLGWSMFDALFMVVITISGVGFGEVRPMGTSAERVHTMIIIGSGLVAVAYTVAGFVQYLTEGEIRNYLGLTRMKRQLDELNGHTIIVGFGRIGALVAEDLSRAGTPFLIIDRSPDRLPEVERRGYLYLKGNAIEEATLIEAGIQRARSLVTVMPDDAANVFLTLTARQMAPGIEIIARAEQPATLKTLLHAGADDVVMPAAIGASRIVSLLTNKSSVQFAEMVTRPSNLGIEMQEFPVKERSSLDGLTLRNADIGRRTGVMVIAVKRVDGRVEFPPSGDEPFAAGDAVVLLGRRQSLETFRESFMV